MREDGYWSIVKRPGGRSGAGAQNHCSHGKSLMSYTYLDWQPFQYFTAEAVDGKMKHWEMQILKPRADETRTQFTVRLKIITPLPRWVRKIMISYMAKKLYLEFFERSKRLMTDFSFNSKV